MKGFFRWFKSKTKIKRWILLILVGIILCCYGMADVLKSTQIEFADLAKIILIFIVAVMSKKLTKQKNGRLSVIMRDSVFYMSIIYRKFFAIMMSINHPYTMRFTQNIYT